MKALPLILTGLFLVSGAAVAADDYSKTIERPDGTLIVNWGQPPPPPDQGAPDFDALDANRDNRLTLDETEAHRLLHSDFLFADRNRDGVITRAELKRWH